MDREKRVYIGSRYVPLIVGKWDIQQEYESLSIVIDEKNNSYTSKSNVPIGIELTDTTYWVMTGNYEGVVLEIEKRLNTKIKEVEDSLTELAILHKNDITNITGKISALDAKIIEEKAELKSNIKDLKDEYDTKIKDMGLVVDGLNSRVQTIDSSIGDLRLEVEDLKKQVETNTGEITKTNVVVDELSKKVLSTEEQVKKMTPMVDTLVTSERNPTKTIPLEDGTYVITHEVNIVNWYAIKGVRKTLVVLQGEGVFVDGIEYEIGRDKTKITSMNLSFDNKELTYACEVNISSETKSTVIIERIMEV